MHRLIYTSPVIWHKSLKRSGIGTSTLTGWTWETLSDLTENLPDTTTVDFFTWGKGIEPIDNLHRTSISIKMEPIVS